MAATRAQALSCGFVAGVAVASVGWWLGRHAGAEPAPVAPVERGDAVARAAAPTVMPAVAVGAVGGDQAVLQRLAAIEARLGELAAALTNRPDLDRTPAGGAPADIAFLADALAQADCLREQRRVAALSVDELFAEAQRFGQKGADPAKAMGLWRDVLARELTAEQRGRALTELGMLQRDADPSASRATLQAAIDLAGLDSQTGAWAGCQLVWTAQRQGDAAGALAMAERVLASPGLNAKLRPGTRWALANAAIDAGAVGRARTELAALRSEAGENPELAKMVADLERRLAGR